MEILGTFLSSESIHPVSERPDWSALFGMCRAGKYCHLLPQRTGVKQQCPGYCWLFRLHLEAPKPGPRTDPLAEGALKSAWIKYSTLTRIAGIGTKPLD